MKACQLCPAQRWLKTGIRLVSLPAILGWTSTCGRRRDRSWATAARPSTLAGDPCPAESANCASRPAAPVLGWLTFALELGRERDDRRLCSAETSECCGDSARRRVAQPALHESASEALFDGHAHGLALDWPMSRPRYW